MIVRFPFTPDSRKLRFNFYLSNLPEYKYLTPGLAKMLIRVADDIVWSAAIRDIFDELHLHIYAQDDVWFDSITQGIENLAIIMNLVGVDFDKNVKVLGGLDQLRIGLLDLMHLSDLEDKQGAVRLKIGILEDGETGKVSLVMRAEDDVSTVCGIPITLGEIDGEKLKDLDPNILPDFHYL